MLFNFMNTLYWKINSGIISFQKSNQFAF
jgi:hypothetical protein